MTKSRALFFFFLLHILARASSYRTYDGDSLRATPCTETIWESNGKTAAGGNGPGSALNQLNSSYGIFVDSNRAVFVTDYLNRRVVKWDQGALSGTIYAEGLCGASDLGDLCYPSAITFNKAGTLFVAVENGSSGSVMSLKKGDTLIKTFITANTSIYGIAWDENEEYLYLGHHREHRVDKYTKNGEFVKVVAGGNGLGPALNQLDYRKNDIQKSRVLFRLVVCDWWADYCLSLVFLARGVAVDEYGSVYVADSGNQRVVKWMVNTTAAVLVAGGNGVGNRTDQFNVPGGMIRDKNGTLYVVDERNHRILCILENAKNSVIIAGGHGQGRASNQLSNPIYLAFDNEGSLYVSDWENFRVQKFAVAVTPSSASRYMYNPSTWTLIFGILWLLVSSTNFSK
ncbi:unnamed protein product [Rotaria socialis]|uniref:NHL repeat-containing protein n=1 Tax=Rotaria socialis TaxID=392032 RepID=A0A817Z9N6_9BILA|nr:unnamed protein product [Rotaria socialis]